MAFRRAMQWFVRAAILAALVGFAGAVWYAQTWISPEQVQTAVESALAEQFPDYTVRMHSARLSVFGGVTVQELTLSRKGESEPFFTAPLALIAHDKEGLNHGRLTIRKIELERPTVRLIRAADGAWHWPSAHRDSVSDRPIPTIVVRDATLIVTDRRPNGWPEFRVESVKCQLVNDPFPILKLQAQATIAPLGLVTIATQTNRETNAVAVRVEVPELIVNPAFAQSLARFQADLPERLQGIAGQLAIKADVQYHPGAAKPLRSEFRVELKNGRIDDDALPWPAEQIQAALTLADGKLIVEKATAKLGPAQVEMQCETVALPQLTAERWVSHATVAAEPLTIDAIEDKLVRLTATFRQMPLGDQLFSRLPERAAVIRQAFQPQGTIDLAYQFSKTATGWKRDLEVRPNKLEVAFAEFRVPIRDLDGSIRKTTESHDGKIENEHVAVRLTGTTNGKRVELSGKVIGGGDDPFMDLRVSGTDLIFNDDFFKAIGPEKPRKFLSTLNASARGDLEATIRKDFGLNRIETLITVTAKDGKIAFDRFPYPIDAISGKVVVKVISSDSSRPSAPGTYKPGDPNPDRVELIGFTGRHGLGHLKLDGILEEAPGRRDQLCTLRIQAKECPIDESFERAIDAIKMGEVFRTIRPSGSVTMGLNLVVNDRADAKEGEFDPERDLTIAVNFKGPTTKPTFFHYELTDTAGAFRYQQRRVELLDMSANHGASRVSMDVGEIRIRDDGAIHAKLGRLAMTPLIVDDDLAKALPEVLRQPLRDAKPRGAMDLRISELVALVPIQGTPAPEAIRVPVTARGQIPAESKYGNPILYWDGQLKLAGAAVEAGTAVTDLIGTVACRGRYDGDHLTGITGNVWLESATFFRQPIAKFKAKFLADAQLPDSTRPGSFSPIKVRITDLHGKLFRGDMTGEAQIVLGDRPEFRMTASAQDVRLEEFATHHQLGNDSELTGIAQAKLYLERETDPKTGQIELQGSGSIDVPQGRMYKLPVLLELVKLAKLHAPDQTGFEEAHATFRIRGNRIVVDKIDLLGNAVSLGGSGELDIDAKNVSLEFYTIWSQTLKKWLTTPLGDPTSALSERLFRIDAVRTNGSEFRYTPRMVPIVTDPFRLVADRVKQRMGLTPEPVIRAVGGP